MSACENKILVRRSLTEMAVLSAAIASVPPADVSRVLERVERVVGELRSDLPESIRLKEAELASEERLLANLLDFVGEGRGSRALAQALVETERRVGWLDDELDSLRSSRQKVFRAADRMDQREAGQAPGGP
jgi:hypothetical protein